MLRLIAERLSVLVPLLALVSFLIFSLVVLVPGDVAVLIAGRNPSPEQIAQVREGLGLNDPFLVQYWHWISGAVQGDLGRSYITHESVMDAILNRLPVTLSLVGVTMVIALILGLILGVVAGLRPGSWIDRLATASASVGVAVPYFWVGMMLVLFLAIDNRILPATRYVELTESPWGWLQHLLIPAMALSIIPLATVARQARASLVSVMSEDYIRTAQAKGLTQWRVVAKHALKNAAVPVVTVFGLEVNRLVGATVVMEQLFALPGVGRLVFTSVFSRDFPMVQGILLFTAAVILLVNLCVDVSYGYFNPKIRQA